MLHCDSHELELSTIPSASDQRESEFRVNSVRARSLFKMFSSTRVKVKQGTVVGAESTLPNGELYTYFRGIPYAVPPLGELRFKPPVPLERFPAPEIDCTKEAAESLQRKSDEVIGSEDCLFLNVYSPKSKSDTPLPVMVFIHGGAFLYDSGNSHFYNPLCLLQEEVIVVTLNYRLGALGFLAVPEANIFGNAAIKDQRLALEWINENISQFNGDTKNITLFGESAGSVCVHLHLLSARSRKLFHKVILQSGLSTIPWAIEHNPSQKAKNLAHMMGCTADDPLEVATFLRNVSDPREFIKPSFQASIIDYAISGRPIPIRPIIEAENPDAIITKPPLELMGDANSINMPVMMGFNSAEGCHLLQLLIKQFDDLDNDLRKFIPKSINLKADDPRSLDLANSIKRFYFKEGKPSPTSVNDLITDFFYSTHKYEAAEIHSRRQPGSPLYFYRFDFDGELNFYKNKVYRMKHIKGASHGDELCYIFQGTALPQPQEDKTKNCIQTMCKLWANFAKNSNPTPEQGGDAFDCAWEPVAKVADHEKFTLKAFTIDERQEMIDNPFGERVDFWRNLTNAYKADRKLSKL